ncbi:MAG: hypothetical protein ABH986_05580 [archaeon]
MFGFGKGKIELVLEKYNFKQGETIKGKVSVKMNKPTKAKELRVLFAGEKTTSSSSVSFGSTRDNTKKTKKVFVHRFEMPLDGEKEYTQGEYPFEIAIPAGILEAGGSLPEGAAGTAIKTIQFLSGSSSRIQWFVEAKLDIEKSFDVSKKVQINVG